MKKIFLKLLALLFAVLLVFGCNTVKQNEIIEDEIVKDEIEKDEVVEEEIVEKEIASETANLEYHPWIDSDLKENITKDMKISLKDDFHLAVNYDWLCKAEIAEGRSNISAFSEVEDITMSKTKALLTDKTLKSRDAMLVQDFYDAFLDWDSRNALGVTPLISTIKDIEGIKSISELSEFIFDFDRSLGVPTLFDIGNTIDFNDSSSYIFFLDRDSFLLYNDAAEYSNRTAMGDRYYSAKKLAFSAIAKRLGYKKDEAEPLFDRTIDFEGKIAEVSLTLADTMSSDIFQKINNVMTLEEACTIVPNFPLEEYLIAIGCTDVNKICVSDLAAVKRIGELYTEENLADIKAYMIVKYVLDHIAALDRYSYDIANSMNNAIMGSSGQEPDEDVAYKTVKAWLTEPLARVYLEKYDSVQLKRNITEICEKVIKSYRKMLEKETWLSEETRKTAIAKLDAIKINAVYPEKWEDDSSLEIHGLSYFEMQKEISKFFFAENLRRTNQKVDKDLWDMDILTANAFYDFFSNSINILLGLLNGVFYYDSMPKEELYGSVGIVIGHEISHAFDLDGSQFDNNGNFFDWWQEADYSAFMEKADKLALFYDQIIPFKDAKVTGSNIQSEAIADIAGLKCILAIAKGEKDFNYDLFFRQFATIWRRISTKEREEFYLVQDEHPLHYLRTNVTLQQFDEFLQTYNIKKGDGMYLTPENRVLVW